MENHHGRINLLESTVDVTGTTMAVVHRLKNWDEENPAGTGQYRIWTGVGSWGAQRNGLLIGLLLRVLRSCAHHEPDRMLTELALLRALVEAQWTAGYTWNQLRCTLHYLMERRPQQPQWRWLCQWFKLQRQRSTWVAYRELQQVTAQAATRIATILRADRSLLFFKNVML